MSTLDWIIIAAKAAAWAYFFYMLGVVRRRRRALGALLDAVAATAAREGRGDVQQALTAWDRLQTCRHSYAVGDWTQGDAPHIATGDGSTHSTAAGLHAYLTANLTTGDPK